MNWLDILIIVAIVISVFGGLKAGIIKVLFTIVGLILGVVLAGNYSEAIGNKLTFISNPDVAGVLAFVIIMAVVMIAAAILAFVIKKIASAILLGWVNHLGGAILGLLLGMIFIGAILSMYLKFLGNTDVISNSWMAGLLLDKFPVVMGFLPKEFDAVRDFFN
jgi:membrane protein required for colicin V production